jgi:hypothetical protein
MVPDTKEVVEYYIKTGQFVIDAPIIYAPELDCKLQIEMLKRKEKVWILFDRVFHLWYLYPNKTVLQCVINELDSQGYKRLDEFHTTYCSAYLYDFGE